MTPVTPVTPDGAGDRRLLATAARQSPIALVFIAGKFIRRIGIINIGIAMAFVFSGRLAGLVAVAAASAAVALAVTATLSWWRFTYCVAGGELIVTKGVLTVERLVIPLERVQSVGIEQKLLHRVVGLVAASVDTAGTDGVEFTIDAVERHRAEALQRLATEHDGQPNDAVLDETSVDTGAGSAIDTAIAVQPAEVLIRRTPQELVRIGLTAVPWGGLVALFPLIAFGDEIGDVLGLDLSIESTVADSLDGLSGWSVILVALGLLAAATVVGLALQVVRTLFVDWDLTLVKTSAGLRRTAGLTNTTSTASTLRRIQAVATYRSPIQRKLGIRRVTLETVGAGNLVIPGSTDDDVARLRSVVFDSVEPAVLDRMVSRWTVFLAVRKTVVICVAVAVATAFALGWWALSILVAVPVSWAVSERAWRLRRWGLGGGRIAERQRLVSETTKEIDVGKAQAVTLEQTFFERRRGLASVRLSTAAGSITIPTIPADGAEELRDRLLHLVESSGRPGM